MAKKSTLILPIIFILLLSLSGCAVNPVTGKHELCFISEASEIEMGTKQYLPSRQMHGGDYSSPEIVSYVRGVGNKLAAVSDRKLPYEFNVLNDSTPNAWALPGGKIVINRGLLVELDSEAELAAVLGHEIVHAAARHGAHGMQRGMLLQGAVMAAGIASQNSDYGRYAVGAAGVAAQLLNQKYGRDDELEADFYGMKYMAKAGYDPRAAIKLQQTFVKLSKSGESNWLSGLFASHPPSQERVDTNRRTAATLPPGGIVGRERYQHAIAKLLHDREAYKTYDAGRKALKDGDDAMALQLAKKALRLQPNEALFHSLRGDIRLKQQRWQDAVTNYNRAIQRDDHYFHYYLQRGLARLELHDTAKGKADLKKSLDFLPTAPAMNALGKLTLAAGDTAMAKKYFAGAASSKSSVGKAARSSFIQLDLPDNPHKYLPIRIGRNHNHDLLLQIRNTTNVAVNNITYVVQYRDTHDQTRTIKQQLNRKLAANKSVTISTGIGPFADLKHVYAKVVQAGVTNK